MGITYDPTKPASGDAPSADQGPMQTNFASLNTYLIVDHVAFSDAQYGMHKQVTFGSNNVPAVPTSPPVLFTQNDAFSTPQLYWYSGNSTKTSDQYDATSTNGSAVVLGGVIVKWGSLAGNGPFSVVFAKAFPNTVFSVQLTAMRAASAVDYRLTASPTTTGFSGTVTNSSTMYWFAIGN